MSNKFKIKVIVKTELFNGQRRPILFLPNTAANSGTIAYYSPLEGHGEASLSYYEKCKHEKNVKAANDLILQYDAIDKENSPDCIRAYKMSTNDRAVAWNRG